MSIRDTLLAAAEIIGEDADGLLASHGINGQWIEIDDSDMDAHTEYDRMIAVRDELLRLAGANLEVIEWKPASEPPDDETSVLVRSDHSVFPGYPCAGDWITDEGGLIYEVTHWAHMPEGPK